MQDAVRSILHMQIFNFRTRYLSDSADKGFKAGGSCYWKSNLNASESIDGFEILNMSCLYYLDDFTWGDVIWKLKKEGQII